MEFERSEDDSKAKVIALFHPVKVKAISILFCF
jgi:hypothetical protein